MTGRRGELGIWLSGRGGDIGLGYRAGEENLAGQQLWCNHYHLNHSECQIN